MVNFSVKTDFSEVNKMIKRYGDKAIGEYKKAVNKTVRHGMRVSVENTPHKVGTLRKSWRSKQDGLNAVIFNNANYVNYVNEGWARKSPILPKRAKILIFPVGKQSAARSSTSTLMRRYKAASKSLKGKGLNQLEKARAATAKSGVVVTKAVNKPASFRGYRFIDKRIFPPIEKRFMMEMQLANKRLVA